MIVIDMDMPKNCGECKTGICTKWLEKSEQEIWSKRADNCPIKCDIEDIKAEINRKANSGQWSESTVYGMQKALAIIDKHCGKENE